MLIHTSKQTISTTLRLLFTYSSMLIADDSPIPLWSFGSNLLGFSGRTFYMWRQLTCFSFQVLKCSVIQTFDFTLAFTHYLRVPEIQGWYTQKSSELGKTAESFRAWRCSSEGFSGEWGSTWVLKDLEFGLTWILFLSPYPSHQSSAPHLLIPFSLKNFFILCK